MCLCQREGGRMFVPEHHDLFRSRVHPNTDVNTEDEKGQGCCCAHATQYLANIVVGDCKYTIAIFTKLVEVGKAMDGLV